MRRLVDLILLTSVYTACCATGLCMATEMLVNGSPPQLINHLHLLVFGSTLVVYNLHHAAKKQLAGIYKGLPRPVYVVFAFAGTVMAAYGLWFLSWKMLAGCFVLGILSFGYSFPIVPLLGGRKLREIGWLKITDLALVWTIVTSVLPVLYWDRSIKDFPFEILLRFAFIFTLCIIFDLRDVSIDKANRISTLPDRLGPRRSYRLIDISLTVFVLLSVVQYVRYGAADRLAGAIMTALITRTVAWYLSKERGMRLYIFLADGVMLLYALTVLLPHCFRS